MAAEVPNNLDFILIWPYLGISTGRATVKWRSGCLEDAQKQMGGEEGSRGMRYRQSATAYQPTNKNNNELYYDFSML